MSLEKKSVTTYSKSLFQNIINFEKSNSTSKESISSEGNQFQISKTILPNTKQYNSSITISAVGEELRLLAAFLKSSKEVESLFNNPTLPEQRKLKVIFDLFPGLTLISCSFLKVLAEKMHLNLLPEISEEYDSILLKFKKSTKVKLIVASTLEESYGNLLLNALKKTTKSEEIILEVSYNPQLLGGLIIEYNSISIDASILKEFSLFFNEK